MLTANTKINNNTNNTSINSTTSAEIHNINTNLSSSSDISLESSIMQQLTSASQSSQLSQASSLASASLFLLNTSTSNNNPNQIKQTKSYHRISAGCRMESDKILSSSSNYMIHGCGSSGDGCSAALAEAELDELDDLCGEIDQTYDSPVIHLNTTTNNNNIATLASLSDEVDFVDFVETALSSSSCVTSTVAVSENSSQLIASNSSALIGGAGQKCNDLMSNSKVNIIKQNLLNASTASSFTSSSPVVAASTTKTSTPTVTTAAVAVAPTVVLSPEERVSNEAKEYWATIDLYNNSKMAFNKRLKSVKLKREKLNIELTQRKQHLNQNESTTTNCSIDTATTNTITTTSSCCLLSKSNKDATVALENHSSETETVQCMCVKCSILYHESLISKGKCGLVVTKTCSKCNKVSGQCKCCCQNLACNLACDQTTSSFFDSAMIPTAKVSTTSIGSNVTLLSNNSELMSLKSSSSLISSNNTINSESALSSTNATNTNTKKSSSPIKQELSQLDDKLFNIKNELVNLSETSLDVFQLLLQLSDTMLDINTQLNNNQSSLNYSQAANSNQLFPLNTFMNSEANNFLYEEEENQEDDIEIHELTTGEGNQLIRKELKLTLTSNNNNNNAIATGSTSEAVSNAQTNTGNTNSSSTHKTNVIEEFLHKTLNTSHSSSNSLRITSSSNNNSAGTSSSISNIINSLNNRNHSSVSRNGSFFTTPSQSFRSTLTANKSSLSKPSFSKPLNLNKLTDSSLPASSPSSVANLIENIYDKTSVTQFVDALLNQNPSSSSSTCKSKTQSINSIDETSNISDCCYSTLSSTTTTHNTEPVYQSIDPEYMNSSSLVSKKHQHQQLSTVATTLTTSQILARQPTASLVSSKQHQSFNLKKANSIYATNQMKSSQSNCSSSSSSSSSSSGCGGSSSICSSSNTDLTYMAPETTGNININRNSTSSTSSSVLASPLSCLSSSSSNNESINQVSVKKATPEHLPVRAYESSGCGSGSSGNSSSSSSPQNSLISGSSAFSYSSNCSSSSTLSRYKRSNSVNYKSMNSSSQLPTASTSSIANRKPSFKFESNILNKVQFMNSNKMNEQNNNNSYSGKQTTSPLKSLNEVIIPSQSLLLKQQDNSMSKRNSLGRDRDDIYEQSQKLIKRQQSVNSHKSFQNQPNLGQLRTIQQMNNSSLASNSNKSPASPSLIINQIKMNQHQMSLDSGIFLPSETEDYNTFNLNVVR